MNDPPRDRHRDQHRDQHRDPERDSERTARLAAVSGLGLLLFNYPLMSLFDSETLVLGLPLLWVYLFVAWSALVGLVALTIRRSR